MEISTTEARNQFSEVISRAVDGKEPVVLTREGKPLVAILSVERLQALENLAEELEDERDARDYIEAKAEWKKNGGHTISLDESLTRHGLTRADLEK